MLRVLVAPRPALQRAAHEPRLVGRAVVLLGVVTLLGVLTLPRQVPALFEALLGTEGPPHGALMYVGLRRLIILDRLIPPLTPMLAGVFIYGLAGAWLPGTTRGRRSLLGVLIAGLTPLVVLRAGELATVWLAPTAGLSAGEVMGLPRLFTTGPAAFMTRDSIPVLLDVLDARVNLVAAWIVALWVRGLRTLEEEWAAWQVVVPLLAWAGAATLTWWLGTPVIALLLSLS